MDFVQIFVYSFIGVQYYHLILLIIQNFVKFVNDIVQLFQNP